QESPRQVAHAEGEAPPGLDLLPDAGHEPAARLHVRERFAIRSKQLVQFLFRIPHRSTSAQTAAFRLGSGLPSPSFSRAANAFSARCRARKSRTFRAFPFTR